MIIISFGRELFISILDSCSCLISYFGPNRRCVTLLNIVDKNKTFLKHLVTIVTLVAPLDDM